MQRFTVTTKSSAQIAADFDAAFSQINPNPKSKFVTHADRLEPYRKAIMKQRRRGLTWDQIAAGMAAPSIDEKVTGKTLHRIFGGTRKSRAASVAPAQPVRERLFLDPVTGLRITPIRTR